MMAATVVAALPLQAYCIPQDAASAIEVADLWGKLRGCKRQAVLSSYAAMREMGWADLALGDAERRALERFAATHALTAEEKARLRGVVLREQALAVKTLAHLVDPGAAECAQSGECGPAEESRP